MATIEQVLEHAVSLHQGGQVQQAVMHYQKILAATQHKHPQALQLLGLALGQLKQHAQAIDTLQKALALDPQSPQAHHALASSMIATGDRGPAQTHLITALKLEPKLHPARIQLAALLEDQGRIDDAIGQYMQLLNLEPDHVPSLNNLAGLLLGQGQLKQAQGYLQRALALVPEHLPAHCNLAMIQDATGQTDQAIDTLKQACQLHKTDPQPRYQLAVILKREGQLTEADSILQQIIALHPEHAQAWTRRGEIQQQLNNPGHALMAYDEAIKCSPENAVPGLKLKRALALPIIVHDVEQIDLARETLEHTITRLTQEQVSIVDPLKQVTATPFYLAYHGRDDKPLLESLTKLYRQASPMLNWQAPHVDQPRDPNARIRIAMVSKYLNNHTIGMFMLGLAQQLDPARFELSVFHVSNQSDQISTAINAKAVHHAVLPPDLQAARHQISSQKPDIVLYPDIGMEPMTYFLAFARLAKVQCAWWGHPQTTGIDTIDYYLSSKHLEPANGDAHYTEKLVRFENLAIYPEKPTPRPADQLTPLQHWGINDGSNIYLCCQSLFKIHPDFDHVLKQIIEQDASSLIVFFQGREDSWLEPLRSRWNKLIGPMSRRIIFLPRQNFPMFLELIQHARVILDTLHFTGGNTTFQCLGLSQPIVTLLGKDLKSRITTAAYKHMGFDSLIANDVDEYVRLAIRLATDHTFARNVRQRISERSGVLFANPKALDEWQDFFVQAVK
ncbi:MAG: tetratricopeptide repeat protein [Phycisphaeraceae bacterium JB051]